MDSKMENGRHRFFIFAIKLMHTLWTSSNSHCSRSSSVQQSPFGFAVRNVEYAISQYCCEHEKKTHCRNDQNFWWPKKHYQRSRISRVRVILPKPAQEKQPKQNGNPKNLQMWLLLQLSSKLFPWGVKTQYRQSYLRNHCDICLIYEDDTWKQHNDIQCLLEKEDMRKKLKIFSIFFIEKRSNWSSKIVRCLHDWYFICERFGSSEHLFFRLRFWRWGIDWRACQEKIWLTFRHSWTFRLQQPHLVLSPISLLFSKLTVAPRVKK